MKRCASTIKVGHGSDAGSAPLDPAYEKKLQCRFRARSGNMNYKRQRVSQISRALHLKTLQSVNYCAIVHLFKMLLGDQV